MQDGLKPGDFLVFQLESGFAMMRLLAEANGIWHVTVYGDFFPDVESAEAAAADPSDVRPAAPGRRQGVAVQTRHGGWNAGEVPEDDSGNRRQALSDRRMPPGSLLAAFSFHQCVIT